MIKIFDQTPEWGGNKVNFVDHNNCLLGYDMMQGCCEYAGWFISTMEEKASYEVCEDLHQTNGASPYELGSYSFCREYFSSEDSGGDDFVARFKLVSRYSPDLYLHLFNCHNGYYGHGFTFSTPTRDGCL
jgi:hypothetical protein